MTRLFRRYWRPRHLPRRLHRHRLHLRRRRRASRRRASRRRQATAPSNGLSACWRWRVNSFSTRRRALRFRKQWAPTSTQCRDQSTFRLSHRCLSAPHASSMRSTTNNEQSAPSRKKIKYKMTDQHHHKKQPHSQQQHQPIKHHHDVDVETSYTTTKELGRYISLVGFF